MGYFIIGASGSGKTACLGPLKKRLPHFSFYDFDAIGVPEHADKKWRQEATEAWLKKLMQNKTPNRFCLLGQMVPGEILASPSAAKLKEIYIILLDCDDAVRIQRLRKRNNDGVHQDTLNWASWLRVHCQDPTWEPHVVQQHSSPLMNFTRWNHLKAWNKSIHFKSVDTTACTIEQVANFIAHYILLQNFKVNLKPLEKHDIAPLSDAFLKEKFHKTQALFEKYLQEQVESKRSMWVAYNHHHQYLAYITILWQSSYLPFADKNIPEIHDFNVLPSQQNKGIGTQLLAFAENQAAKTHSCIGLGVGLHKDYGAAQSLYIKKGYVPNKQGITHHLKTVVPGGSYPIDDDCILWLIKEIRCKDER